MVVAEDATRARALQDALSGHEPLHVVVGGDHLDLTSNPVMVRLENPDDVRQALDHVGLGTGELRAVLVLDQTGRPALDDPIDALLDAQRRAYAATLHVTQALLAHPEIEARIAVITQSAHSVHEEAPNLAHGPLPGLLRTLRLEHPELGTRQFDVDGDDRSWSAVLDDLRAWPDDRETAFRGGERFVRRVRRLTDRDIAQSLTRRRAVAEGENYALEVGEPGSLHSLELVPTERRVPGEGEVEIRVTASGINFRDVLSAHGILPGYPRGAAPLGYECAGIITALGPGVHDFAVGERVLALGRSTMARYTVVKTALTVPVPPSLTDEQAAALPIAYLTALYALEHLAHIEAGERVLIHAATGGVGLAAVQIAQAAGAEIFATCGSEEKRALLARLGVRHIMNSRTSDFAAEIMAATNGQGVDIVLNSLTGPFIPLSLGVLGPYGRFLELGRRDIYEDAPIGLAPFKQNLSFFGVDLDRLADERPQLVRRLLHTLVARLTDGSLGPLPVTASSLKGAEEAFRTMAQARHTGKLVLSVGAELVEVIETLAAPPIRADGCYVLTGGTGGLGLQVARYLTERGHATSCCSPAVARRPR